MREGGEERKVEEGEEAGERLMKGRKRKCEG